MAMTNDLQSFVGIDATSGVREYIIPAGELASLGAFTTGDITLAILPRGAILTQARWKHTEAVVGASISAATARMTFNGTSLGGAALDIYANPSTTAETGYITDITGVGTGNMHIVNLVKMHFVFTGANASVITAGEVHAWFNYTVLG